MCIRDRYTVSAGLRWNLYSREFVLSIIVFLSVSSFFSFPARSKHNHGKKKSVNDFSATRYLVYTILNIVSRTVQNVFVSVPTPKISCLLALWNCYLKSSSTKRKTSGTRMLISTPDIVVCSLRMNWFLHSLDLVILQQSWRKRSFSTEGRCRIRRNWRFWAYPKI